MKMITVQTEDQRCQTNSGHHGTLCIPRVILSLTVRFDMLNVDTVGDCIVNANGDCAIGMDSFNSIRSICSVLQLGWIGNQQHNFIANLIANRLALLVKVMQVLIIHQLSSVTLCHAGHQT